MYISSAEIRSKYLNFFASKGHAIVPSAPLVPENDPSVLFNTAGMQPLIPYLLGAPHPMGKRIVDVQKCVRTGDIDDVGDNRHLTFFEMLGNWSLGDYFKKESITWSYEFLTSPEWLGIDPSMLTVTVFEGNTDAPRDEESAAIWQNLGMPVDRISYLPAVDNWWAAGATGPCGPDTEIFYYVGAGAPHGNCATNPDDWMEIWNNVFMQYDRQADGTLSPLPAPCVDTGMGLERVTATLNGFTHIFETDIFLLLLEQIKEVAGDRYSELSGRIIADHLRTAVHMMADGVVPKNVAQWYVLRRIIRRAVRECVKMSIPQGALLTSLAQMVIATFSPVYESVALNADKILEELAREEDKFSKTLAEGTREFEKIVRGMQEAAIKTGNTITNISGQRAFTLFDTYGFPIEMTVEIAREHGMTVDREGFDQKFTAHQELSRTASAGMFKGGLADQSDQTTALHSACHLMLAGLRQVLGSHVGQAGSNITPERLRFDFTHPDKMTPEQITLVENYVNAAIQSGLTVTIAEEVKETARARGVSGAFWEKYPEIVKVYKMSGGDGVVYSEELCGGPHVSDSSKMGVFKIVKEESSSSGVRRIKATLIA
jgi:alanyl-tRNA synthetase